MPLISQHTIDQIKANNAYIVSNFGSKPNPDQIPDVINALKTNTSVQILELSGLDLNAHADDLADVIRQHPKLVKVMINGKLTPTNSKKIADAVGANPSIEVVDLDHNNLGDVGAKALAKAITQNPNITSMRFIGCEASEAGLDAITQAIAKKPEMLELGIGIPTLTPAMGQSIANLIADPSSKLMTLGVYATDCPPQTQDTVLDAYTKNRTLVRTSFGADNFDKPDYERFSEALVESANPNLIECGAVGTRELTQLLINNQITANNYAFQLAFNGRTEMPAYALQDAMDRSNAVIYLSVTQIGASRETMESHFEALAKFADSLPKVDATSPTLTPDQLIAHNHDGFCALDNPKTWEALPQIVQQLEANGTPLDMATLEQPSKFREDYLLTGVKCGQFPTMIAALNHNGEYFREKDLLKDDGTPNDLLRGLINHNHVGALFTEENWEGERPSAPRSMLNQLPHDAQKQVSNIHTLTAELMRNQRHASRSR